MAAADVTGPARVETVKLGDELPDLGFQTDQGTGTLRTYRPDKWLLIFSYPKDMTPVCATVSSGRSERGGVATTPWHQLRLRPAGWRHLLAG